MPEIAKSQTQSNANNQNEIQFQSQNQYKFTNYINSNVSAITRNYFSQTYPFYKCQMLLKIWKFVFASAIDNSKGCCKTANENNIFATRHITEATLQTSSALET